MIISSGCLIEFDFSFELLINSVNINDKSLRLKIIQIHEMREKLEIWQLLACIINRKLDCSFSFV